MNYDYVVVGSGFAGATIAERIANELNKKVLVIEKRDHIGGNMFDYVNEFGIITHKYGPHLFHTNLEKVYEYVKKFGDWFQYEHRVLGKVRDKLVPIPFNLTSIDECFDEEKASKLKEILLNEFGEGKKIPILELRNHKDKDINDLAEFIYENVFLHYTMKQWDQKPDEIDPNVTNRVPVYVSRDDRYFQDKFQIMPVGGYTRIFEKMLNNKNIDVKLSTNILDIIEFKDDEIYIEGKKFEGKLIYTGAIDELFKYKFGELPYRSLKFEFENKNLEYFQPVGTVNYPTKEDKFTRITEYKHFTSQENNSSTTVIMREYPCKYETGKGMTAYYPINNEESNSIYNKYVEEVKKFKNLYLLGRLAQYKYYNMDLIINEALELFDKFMKEQGE